MSLLGLNIARRALLTNQRALEVTGQNVANAETPGYSRQVTVTRSVNGPGAQARSGTGGALGAGGGVEVARVYRAHAGWLDRSAAALSSRSGQANAEAIQASQLEGILQEPGDGGLHATLERFYDAAGDLASRPGDTASRQALTRAGAEVATRFRELTKDVEGLQSDLQGQFAQGIDEVNDLASRVADLSKQIGQAQSTGAAPNELLDQRDQLLDELSSKAGVTVSGQEGADVVVSLGGVTLVQGDHVTSLEISSSNPFQVVTSGAEGEGGEPVSLTGGALRAQQQWGTETLPAVRSQIAELRDQFASSVNALHQSGKDQDGNAGAAFFVADAEGNLSVNPDLSASRRVAAGDGSIAGGGVARGIADLGKATSPLTQGYSALVADIGARASDSMRNAEVSQASREQIQAMQSSESGVNLDEELANMVSLQHAYSASARLLSTYDEMLGTLIERTAA